jgi:exopolyphosphatase/guanosine-5'-triphosphate,3'-diphosphate pyrophosphatase
VVEFLSRLDPKARQQVPGLDRRRADIIVAGGIVAVTALELAGAREVVLCEWALREGLLVDYIARHRADLARAIEIPDPRRRSVLEMAEQYHHDAPHCRHVAGLALALFDALRPRHGLDSVDRTILEYAALLHDTGHHIDHEGHHKHSYYLIKNGGLRGFEPVEIEMIANIARYHRRGLPQKKHASFAALPRRARRAVGILAGILRLADGLDRTHRQRVRSLSASVRGGVLNVKCRTCGEVELELWGAGKRLDLLQKSLRLPVKVSVAAPRRRGPGGASRRTAARR